MEKWPNFFIVGTGKGGTTSLWKYLRTIPGIFLSNVKEPTYFSPSATQRGYQIKDRKEYLALFENSEDSFAIGEASPSYLKDPESAMLIHEQIPHAKIIISLRDPVERLYSHYFMYQRKKNNPRTFHEYIQQSKKSNQKFDNFSGALRMGMYTENVKRYLEIFGQNQVKILIFEEWTKNVKKTIQDLINFLEVDYEITTNFDDSIKNMYHEKKIVGGTIGKQILESGATIKVVQKIIPKSGRLWLKSKLIEKDTNASKPKMEPKEREFLKNYYKDDVRNLEILLGRKLPWKNFHCLT